jgi:hypothetical protein
MMIRRQAAGNFAYYPLCAPYVSYEPSHLIRAGMARELSVKFHYLVKLIKLHMHQQKEKADLEGVLPK